MERDHLTDGSGMTDESGGTDDSADARARRERGIGVDVATVGAISLALFLFLKAYAAAKFSLTTASALLIDAPLSVLLGTLISYAYFVLPVLSVASLAWFVALQPSATSSKHLWRPAALVTGLLTGALSPWPYLWPLLAGAFALVVIDWLANPMSGHMPWLMERLGRFLPSLATLVIYYFALAALVVFLATMTRMWTPVEVVTIDDGNQHSRFVAHVVSVEGEWTTLLTADTRKILRVRSDDVEHRQICHFSAQPRGRRPLIYVILATKYSSPNPNCRIVCADPEVAVPSLPTDRMTTLAPCRW